MNCLLPNAESMKTQSIEINGEQLSYIDKGKGKKTLLFLHGAFINKEYWEEQLIYFSDDYRVIAIDLPGHGDSSYNQDNWTGSRFGKDIGKFIEELKLKEVIVIGHSFGSDVMLETAVNYPSSIIGLIEIDHLKNVGSELPKEAIDHIIKGLNTDFEKTCEQFAKQALLTKATKPEIVLRLLKDYKKISPDIGIPLLENGLSYANREVELLKSLKIKLHLIHVDYTPTNEEPLQQYLSNNYKLYILKGTCHYPMLENPVELNSILNDIISKIVM